MYLQKRTAVSTIYLYISVTPPEMLSPLYGPHFPYPSPRPPPICFCLCRGGAPVRAEGDWVTRRAMIGRQELLDLPAWGSGG